MANDEDEKPGDEDKPPAETMMEQQRDPEEAAFAEQAIKEYGQYVLDSFRQNVETALDGFSAWIQGQDATTFNNAAHFEQLAKATMDHIMGLCGDSSTPIGQVLKEQIGGIIDQSVRDESEAPMFVEQLKRGARDASWFLRDNLQNVLSGQWDQLLDLAYEGSTDFIPVIHQFGLPIAEWSPAEMTANLQKVSSAYAATVPKQQEEAISQEGEKDAEQEEEAEESKEEFQKDGEEKAAS